MSAMMKMGCGFEIADQSSLTNVGSASAGFLILGLRGSIMFFRILPVD
jgi:hypothetical protein